MLFLPSSLSDFSLWLLEYISSPISFTNGGWMVHDVHSTPQTREAKVRQNWQPMLVGNWRFSETWQSLHSVKEDLTRVGKSRHVSRAWAVLLSRPLGHGDGDGTIQAACRHQTGSNAMWVSRTKCFMPVVGDSDSDCEDLQIVSFDTISDTFYWTEEESQEDCMRSLKLLPDGLLRAF